MRAFERLVGEKWASRCGWEEGEWGVWFDGVVGGREAERKWWEVAQEREVGERRGDAVGNAMEMGGEKGKGKIVGVESEEGKVVKKKSVFKRLFGIGGE